MWIQSITQTKYHRVSVYHHSPLQKSVETSTKLTFILSAIQRLCQIKHRLPDQLRLLWCIRITSHPHVLHSLLPHLLLPHSSVPGRLSIRGGCEGSSLLGLTSEGVLKVLIDVKVELLVPFRMLAAFLDGGGPAGGGVDGELGVGVLFRYLDVRQMTLEGSKSHEG
jgi:hypothetical protein